MAYIFVCLGLCVVCCCATSYAKREWLKTTFMISHELWVRITTWLNCAVLLQGPLWLQLGSSARSASSAGWPGAGGPAHVAVGRGPWRLPWAFAETASVLAWQLVSPASCPRRKEQEAASRPGPAPGGYASSFLPFFLFVTSE